MTTDFDFLCSVAKVDQTKVNYFVKKHGKKQVEDALKHIAKTNTSNEDNLKALEHYLDSFLQKEKVNLDSPKQAKKHNNNEGINFAEVLAKNNAELKEEIVKNIHYVLKPTVEDIRSLKNELETYKRRDNENIDITEAVKCIQEKLQDNKNILGNINSFYWGKIASLTLILFGFGFVLGALYWHIQGVLAIEILDLRFALILGGFIAGIGATIGFLKIKSMSVRR